MKGVIFCLLLATVAALPNQRLILQPRGQAKIVGGEDASAGEFPYQISFQRIYTDAEPFHFCGGSIYNEKYVITAAHCITGEDFDNPKDLQVVAGALNLTGPTGTEQTRNLTRLIQHEDYFEVLNDIALLEIAVPFVFNEYVQPVTLPEQGENTTGSCNVTGWGTLSYMGSNPDILQVVEVPVVSDEECGEDYQDYTFADSMICAGEEGKDSCQGDSGGPLYCSGYLGGIVSWGRECALADYPGVYTEVAYFVDWIEANAV